MHFSGTASRPTSRTYEHMAVRQEWMDGLTEVMVTMTLMSRVTVRFEAKRTRNKLKGVTVLTSAQFAGQKGVNSDLAVQIVRASIKFKL